MANTIIGVYDNYTHAQSALNELLRSGFDRDDVRLSPSDETPTARQSSLSSNDMGDENAGGWSIGNFFRSLFGNDESVSHHADVYSEAVRRGSYLLTVDAGSEEQHDRAADIMNRYQPVDIDDRSSQWKSQGWTRYDSASPMLSDDEVARDRSAYASSMQSGQTAGTQTSLGGQDMSGSDTLSGTRTSLGGQDMSGSHSLSGTQASVRGQDMSSSDALSGTRTGLGDQARSSGTLEGEARIPVVEEQLKVGKRDVQRGGVRVFSRVTERPVNESVQLREEQVKVERRPADQPATEADLASFKEKAIELRETAEEAVVSKTARVVEEVVVGKQVTERTENINDTVRRTDVEVEQLGAQGTTARRGTMDDDAAYRSHWQSSYAGQGGRYEDYAPAYRYGSSLAGNEKYRGSQWNEMEPQVRTEWESNNAGTPWEKAKDAVRHGWEKVAK